MSWTLVETDLPDHPKLIDLARQLGIPKAHAVGLVTCLWSWSMRYAPDGVLTGATCAQIAAAAQWEGDAAEFCSALKGVRRPGGSSGFLEEREDGALVLHDWAAYSGRTTRAKAADAARKREARKGDPSPWNGHSPSNGHASDSPQDVRETLVNTIQSNPIQSEEARADAREPAASTASGPDPVDALPSHQRDYASTLLLRFQGSRHLDCDPALRLEAADLARDYVPTAGDLPTALVALDAARKKAPGGKPWPNAIRGLLGDPPGLEADVGPPVNGARPRTIGSHRHLLPEEP